MDTTTHNPADYIVPLTIGGLEGRMLHIPMPKDMPRKREILFIYGHHSMLERWWGLMEVLNEYGAVTMPDLPGFGGMDSFYKLGRKPSMDAMADYMAAFIKWRYKRKKVTIVGMSFGFAVATRMLQRFPELTSKVELLVSLVGFAQHDEFTFSPARYLFYRTLATVFSHNPAAWFFRYGILNSVILRTFYGHTHNAKNKFAQADTSADRQRLMDIEVKLWQSNDVRTYMYTSNQMMTLDNTKHQVDLPVWHVSSAKDHFFDHTIIEQHMRLIFSGFHNIPMLLPVHAPSVIADAAMAAPLIPDSLRKLLSEA